MAPSYQHDEAGEGQGRGYDCGGECFHAAQLVETALDAGQLDAQIEALQAEVAALREERNAWRVEALRRHGRTGLRDQA